MRNTKELLGRPIAVNGAEVVFADETPAEKKERLFQEKWEKSARATRKKFYTTYCEACEKAKVVAKSESEFIAEGMGNEKPRTGGI